MTNWRDITCDIGLRDFTLSGLPAMHPDVDRRSATPDHCSRRRSRVGPLPPLNFGGPSWLNPAAAISLENASANGGEAMTRSEFRLNQA